MLATSKTVDQPRVLVIDADMLRGGLCADAVRMHAGCDARVCGPNDADVTASVGQASVIVCACGDTAATRLDALRLALTSKADAHVIILLPADEPKLVTEALGCGAADTLLRSPGYLEQLPVLVIRALHVRRTQTEQDRRTARLHETLGQIQRDHLTLQRLLDRVERLATTDPLTGLGNRRAIDQRADELFSAAVRHGTNISCIAIDLDGLKIVNDTLGHAAGDSLIQTAAEVVRATLRKSDIVARTGGDELVILLPHTEETKARLVAERLVARFEAATKDLRERLDAEHAARGVIKIFKQTQSNARMGFRPVGMSAGVAARRVNETVVPTATALLAQADAALYSAKAKGGGQVQTIRPAESMAA